MRYCGLLAVSLLTFWGMCGCDSPRQEMAPGEGEGAGARVCTPHYIQACPCLSGKVGVATCLDDGTAWGPCDCPGEGAGGEGEGEGQAGAEGEGEGQAGAEGEGAAEGSAEGEGEGQGEGGAEGEGEGGPVSSELGLPNYRDETCRVTPRSEPDPCVWASRADAMIWAEVVEIRAVSTPAAVDGAVCDALLENEAECPGTLHPALELQLRTLRALYGRAPSTLVLHVGDGVLRHFDPYPSLEAGSIHWVASGSEAGQALQVGSQIGVLAYHIGEPDFWTSYDEMFFGLASSADGQEGIAFPQEETRCLMAPPPRQLQGKSLDELASFVASCERNDKAEAWNRTVHQQAVESPQRSMAGTCEIPTGGQLPPGCHR